MSRNFYPLAISEIQLVQSGNIVPFSALSASSTSHAYHYVPGNAVDGNFNTDWFLSDLNDPHPLISVTTDASNAFDTVLVYGGNQMDGSSFKVYFDDTLYFSTTLSGSVQANNAYRYTFAISSATPAVAPTEG
jgi:hypothetical protein